MQGSRDRAQGSRHQGQGARDKAQETRHKIQGIDTYDNDCIFESQRLGWDTIAIGRNFRLAITENHLEWY